jgi:hypothetical protein
MLEMILVSENGKFSLSLPKLQTHPPYFFIVLVLCMHIICSVHAKFVSQLEKYCRKNNKRSFEIGVDGLKRLKKLKKFKNL